MTLDQLQAKIVDAKAQGLNGSAVVKFAGAPAGDQVLVEMGRFVSQPDGTDEVQAAPFFDIQAAV